jgi:hypothetical protein
MEQTKYRRRRADFRKRMLAKAKQTNKSQCIARSPCAIAAEMGLAIAKGCDRTAIDVLLSDWPRQFGAKLNLTKGGFCGGRNPRRCESGQGNREDKTGPLPAPKIRLCPGPITKGPTFDLGVCPGPITKGPTFGLGFLALGSFASQYGTKGTGRSTAALYPVGHSGVPTRTGTPWRDAVVWRILKGAA